MVLIWLIPNHHQPWAAFHTDAWAAVVFLAVLWLALTASPARPSFSAFAGFALVVAAVPFVHWLAGLVPLAGDAAMSLAYLLGFALAVILGELVTRKDPRVLASCVFFAVSTASLVSVALQFNQWIGGTQDDTYLDIWVMNLPVGMRPFANLGQPNQLATLLLWGLLGLMWGWRQGVLQRWLVAAGGAILVFGLALTQSRTGWLSFFVLVALACVWRQRDFGRQLLVMSVGLYGFYLVCLIVIPYLAIALELPSSGSMADRLRAGVGSDLRLQAWAMFFDASLQKPWIGYGWGHTRDAMFAAIPEHPSMAGHNFAQAHMLPLDLVLWVGWPLGLVITGTGAWWLARQARTAKTAEHALLLAAILVVGVHAMLELPLHYAYLLLPTGVFIGVLNARQPEVFRWFAVRKAWIAALAICATVLLGVIIRDYFRVERSFFDLRLEVQRIGTHFDREPPDTWLLHQWRDFFITARAEPSPSLSDTDIEHWRALTLYFPAAIIIDKYMTALQIKGRNEDIAYFRERLCGIMSIETCAWMRNRWAPTSTASSTSLSQDAPQGTSGSVTSRSATVVPPSAR